MTIQAPGGIWGTFCVRMRVIVAVKHTTAYSLSAGLWCKVTFIFSGDALIFFSSSHKGQCVFAAAELMWSKDQESYLQLLRTVTEKRENRSSLTMNPKYVLSNTITGTITFEMVCIATNAKIFLFN